MEVDVMTIYPREFYLKQLRPFYDSDLIKVITGIRRCGKSCLMQSVALELKSKGVAEKDIVFLNLDKRGYKNIVTPNALEKAIDAKIVDEDFKYIFIDEIQNVEGFEPVINAYREEGNCSIFITGSNSYLLSGELVTKLTGRYVQIDMHTLSFDEFLSMKRFLGIELHDNRIEFDEYLTRGGFPKVLEFSDIDVKFKYISDIVAQVFDKDIYARCKIKNRIAFDKVMTYLINNFGSRINLQSLENYFRSALQTPIKKETLRHYIDILNSARILYKCPRFDMKSRRSLMGESKYYLADTGIYFARNIDGRINYGPVLENIVYNYLLNRGYSMSVGQIGSLECDFIARKQNEYFYIQVAMTIADPSTEEREYRALSAAKDHYPRYLFTLDTLLQKRDGVKHVNLIDFIAEGRELV
jgi:predicted AAA+ superfamily ATPase